MADIPGDDYKVLVVDDDAYVRMMLSLEAPEFGLLEASRLSEGWEVVVAERPDAIFVDRRLPDGDGLDLVRQIRADSGLAKIPIFVITVGHDEAERLEVMEAGADEYLPKPIESVELRARLVRVLSIKEA